MATCDVSGTVLDGGGSPVVDAPVHAHIRAGEDPYFDGDGKLISDGTVSTNTDGNGDFTIKLIQGLDYVINIEEANYHKQVTIPETATAELKDL